MKKYLSILIFQCYALMATGQHIEGYISSVMIEGNSTAIAGFEYCRDTVVQANHNLSVQPYGFEEVHYDSLAGTMLTWWK